MKNKKLFVEIHALQNAGASCINRDDTGAPKTLVYGGTERMRVSSQAWKHAMRRYMKYDLKDPIGIRTADVGKLLRDAIAQKNPSLKEKALIDTVKNTLKEIGLDKLNGTTIIPISETQINNIAELAAQGCKDGKAYMEAMVSNPPLDVCLFGRMIASSKKGAMDYANVDASAQIAHAFSTNAVVPQTDFFTATDDITENAGAAYLDSREFTSGVLYRYGNVAVHALKETYEGTDEHIAKAIRDYVEAFLYSMPTGMQNSFANRNIPYAVYVDFRTDFPISMADAFEKPVFTNGEGYMERSAQRFFDHVKKMEEMIKKPDEVLIAGIGFEKLGNKLALGDLFDQVERYVKEYLTEK